MKIRFTEVFPHTLFLLFLLCVPQAQATLINFDDLPLGDIVEEIDGASFSSNTGFSLITAFGFETTSGIGYLGVFDGLLETFFPGDIVTIEFDSLQRNFSAAFVTSALTPLNAFSLVAFANNLIVGSVSSISGPQQTLPLGSEVFSLALSLDRASAFDEVRLVAGPGSYNFNIDDIRFDVPAPSSFLLLALGLFLIFRVRAKTH